jgi:hypothetical protein
MMKRFFKYLIVGSLLFSGATNISIAAPPENADPALGPFLSL